MSHDRIIVLLKAPRPGLAKTRLAASLDAEAAAAIGVVLVERTVAVLRRLEVSPAVGVEIRFSPEDAEPEIARWVQPGWLCRHQGEGDLGRRLQRSFATAFEEGATRVLAIGTDCPGLQESDLLGSLDHLRHREVVLGPALDGGYWLIGLGAPADDLFTEMPWSTAAVFDTTLERALRAGRSAHVLRRLADIDTLADWRGWLRSAPL